MPRPQPLILLPPSEGKLDGGDGPAWRSGAMRDRELDPHRRTMLRVAAGSGAVVRRAPTVPAMGRYSGVLYRELSWASLPAAARRRADDRVRIASGLWGLVAPSDPIPHYRLKMSATLDDLGRLSSWWKPRLGPWLAERSAGALVWDLLPIEHSAAMDWSACSPSTRVTVRFVDEHDRTVSHWNKLLKGALVRWLLQTQPGDVDALERFEHPLGYRYDPECTTGDGPVRAVVLRRPA